MTVYAYCLMSDLGSVETVHGFIRAIGLEVTTTYVEDILHALKNKRMECIAYNGGIGLFGTCSFKFIELNPQYFYAFDPNVSIKELMLNYYLEQ